MEHAPLVWMGACRSTLSQLDAVQHRAMNIIGPNCCLPRLEPRHHVAALSFLFKLHCQPQHSILQRMLPPPPPPPPTATASCTAHYASAISQIHLSSTRPPARQSTVDRSSQQPLSFVSLCCATNLEQPSCVHPLKRPRS